MVSQRIMKKLNSDPPSTNPLLSATTFQAGRISRSILPVLLAGAHFLAAAQSLPATSARWGRWNVTARDGCSTTRESTSGDGVHRIVEVATGINYLDEKGRWTETRELITIMPDGKSAAATNGQHRVYFPADLSEGVTIVTISNRVLLARPTRIDYLDVITGKSVQLAALNDAAVARLQPPNTVVYENAFLSEYVSADVRFVYARAGLECDIVMKRKPRSPEAFSMSAEQVQLRVTHEWADVPDPVITPRVLEPNLVDEELDLGDLWFPTGSAFSWAGITQGPTQPSTVSPEKISPPYSPSDTTMIPVAKKWAKGPGRVSTMTETVNWSDIAPRLAQLPEMAGMPHRPASAEIGSSVRQPEWPRAHAAATKTVLVASAPERANGVVLDWILYITGGPDGHYFNSNGTFWISSVAIFYGTLTFNQGTTLKYSSGAWLYTRNGGIQCNGTADHPTLMTSENDDVLPTGVASDRLPWSTGIPSQSAAVAIYAAHLAIPQTFSNMKIRWAQVAIETDADQRPGPVNLISGCSIEYCQTGFYAVNSGAVVQDSQKCRVTAEAAGLGQWSYTGSMSDICAGNSDSDGNQIPDYWEYQWFSGVLGTSGAAADDDGDRVSNLNEYIAQSNPVQRPVLTTTPVYQIAQEGTAASFSCAGLANHDYTYEWSLGGILRGTGTSFFLSSAQLSDYGQWLLRIKAPNPQVYLNYYVRLVVCDTWAWDIWTAFNNGITPQSSDQVWLTRTPGNTQNDQPSVQWNPNSLIHGKTGYTAISPIGYLDPLNPTQITVTALTPRHGYARGHGMGSPDGWRTDWNGRKIWFLDADNNPVAATVAGAYVRNPDNHGKVPPDWTVVIFSDPLPASITPVPQVMLVPPRFSVCFRTGQTLFISANMPPFSLGNPDVPDDLSRPPFNQHSTFIGGDSGAPNLIPLTDGSLVFVGGTTTTLNMAIQQDMNDLSDHISAPHYTLSWLTIY